ncbi:hypothetical protein P8452_10770 [Trifolium repens]|nr:hypothetical protein P8452_10770 [Trifolium repens]
MLKLPSFYLGLRTERCTSCIERCGEKMRGCGEKDETRGPRRKFMGKRRLAGTETAVGRWWPKMTNHDGSKET